MFESIPVRTSVRLGTSLLGSWLALSCLGGSALAQSRVTPVHYSLLPLEQGFELRAHAEVLRFGIDGELQDVAADAFIEAPLWEDLPQSVWVHTLPATETLDPLYMVQQREQACTRVRMEDGRDALRVSTVLPAPPEINFTPPPGTPQPTPLGSLGWANERSDPAHLAGLVARDSEGLVYAFGWEFLPYAAFRLRVFAPDCRLVDQVFQLHSFDAHPAKPGVYVVRDRGPAASLALSRFEGGQRVWDRDLLTVLQVNKNQIIHTWLRALDDGSVLLVGAGGSVESLELALFDDSGQVVARGQVAGRSVAALREQDGSLLLAVGERADRAGARSLVELDRSLRVVQRVEIEEGFVLGPLGSSEAGLRSAEWLVHAEDNAVRAAEYSEPSRWGSLRFMPGGAVEWLQPMGELRPRLRLAEDELLASRRQDGIPRLAKVGEGGSTQWIEPLRVASPSMPWVAGQDALDDGRVARLWRFGNVWHLQLQRESQTLWSRTLDAVPRFSTTYLHAEWEAGRICASASYWAGAGAFTLYCFNVDDGTAMTSPSWQGQPTPNVRPLGGMSPDGAASYFLRYFTSAGAAALRHLQAAPGGTEPVSTTIPISNVVNCAQRAVGSRPGLGAAVIESVADGFQLNRYSAAGDLLWQQSLPEDLDCPGVLGLAAGGEVLIGEFAPPVGSLQPTALMLVSGEQSVVWRTPLDAVGVDATTALLSADSGSWIEVPESRQWLGLVAVQGAAAVLMLDQQTGVVNELFRPTLNAQSLRGWELARSPVAGEVLLVHREGTRASIRRLQVADSRLGAPAQLSAPWSGSQQSIARVADRLEAVSHAPDIAAGIQASTAAQAPPLAADQPLGPEHSGLWYDPQTTGQGLMLDVEAGTQRWFAAWFGFVLPTEAAALGDIASHRGLRWYSMLGQGSAATGMPIAGTLYSTADGTFSGGAPVTREQGSAELRAIDCNTLELGYRIEPAQPGQALPFAGSRRLQRLGPAPASCGGTSLPQQWGLSAASTGSWVLEGRPSQGLLIQVDPGLETQAGALWGAWFGFSAHPTNLPQPQHWLTVAGRSVPGQAGVVELEWMRTTGGLLDALPTANTHVIGRGRLRFTACDRGVLEYSFDSSPLQDEAFGGLQGQVAVRRFEPCG